MLVEGGNRRVTHLHLSLLRLIFYYAIKRFMKN